MVAVATDKDLPASPVESIASNLHLTACEHPIDIIKAAAREIIHAHNLLALIFL